MRYFFEIAYKGTDYHGWQRQPNALSVQEVVEEKMSLLLGVPVEITGSGRTDTGVHCEQQYFHVDLEGEFTEDHLFKMNSFLPSSILLVSFHPVDGNQHARFDAISRRYYYQVLQIRNPFLTDTTHLFFKELDIEAMNKASELLLGKKDFECFSKVRTDVHTFICEIFEASWKSEGNLLIFDICGNRFLRGMVRAIVGTLLEVGEGKRTIEDFELLLNSGKRTEAGSSVPAKGLILKEVNYPKGYFSN